jgi:hypothetical protein
MVKFLAVCQYLVKNFGNNYKSPVVTSTNKMSVNMCVTNNNILQQNNKQESHKIRQHSLMKEIHADKKKGDPKIPGNVKKIHLKESYKFETIVHFKALPL